MRKTNRRSYLFYLFFLLAMMAIFWYLSNGRSASTVTYSKMVQLFRSEQVESFTVQNNIVDMHLKDAAETDGKKDVSCSISSFDAFYADMNNLVQKQRKDGILKDYEAAGKLLARMEKELAEARQKLTILRAQPDGTLAEEPLEEEALEDEP